MEGDVVQPLIPMQEIAALLSKVARGQVAFTTGTWPTGYHWRIAAEGYDILIFDDAGESDYVEWAVAPDGRKTTFDEWYKAALPLWPVEIELPKPRTRREEFELKKYFKSYDPIHLLSPEDHLALEAIMNRELVAIARREARSTPTPPGTV